MPKILFDLSVQCANDQILAKPSNEIVFWTSCWQRKSESSAILCGTGLSRVSTTDRESKDRALRAICTIIEETSNVDKLHATREKTLHVQKYRTAEVTICMIPERTARSLPTVTVRWGQCHCPRYRKSHMVAHPDIQTEHIQKPMTSPVAQ